MSLSEKREHILEGTSAGMAIYFEDKVREAVLRVEKEAFIDSSKNALTISLKKWREIFGEKLT